MLIFRATLYLAERLVVLAPDLWLVPSIGSGDGDGCSDGDGGDNVNGDFVLIARATTDLEASAARDLALDWGHTRTGRESACVGLHIECRRGGYCT